MGGFGGVCVCACVCSCVCVCIHACVCVHECVCFVVYLGIHLTVFVSAHVCACMQRPEVASSIAILVFEAVFP